MTKKEKITKLTLDDKTSIKINLQQNLQLNDVSILIINNTKFNSLKSYNNNLLKIFNRQININNEELVQTTRIGISKAVDLKWRWYLKQSRSVSKRVKGDKIPKLHNKFKNFNV
mgnify:CR=1 FL=1